MSCDAIFVDLDGTLLPGTSSEKLFAAYLYRQGVIGFRQIIATIVFGIRYGWYAHARTINKGYLYHCSYSEVCREAQHFVRYALLPRIDWRLLEQISLSAGPSTKFVLLSGAPDFICEPLVSALRFDGCIASIYARTNEHFCLQPPLQHPYGETKYALAEDYCRRHNISLRHCAAYADAQSDLPLLHAVEKAVVVNPDRYLRQYAQSQAWQVYRISDHVSYVTPQQEAHNEPTERNYL